MNESDVFEATAGAIREVADLRAAAIDGSLTLKMTRAAVVDRLALGVGGDRLLKRTYKECMKAAMLEVAGALQLDQSPACLLYTSPSPRDRTRSRMPSSA